MPSSVIFESNGKHWVFIGEDEEGEVIHPAVSNREIGRVRDIINQDDKLIEVIDSYYFDLPDDAGSDSLLYDYTIGSFEDITAEYSFKTLIKATPGASQLKNPILFELYID